MIQKHLFYLILSLKHKNNDVGNLNMSKRNFIVLTLNQISHLHKKKGEHCIIRYFERKKRSRKKRRRRRRRSLRIFT
jgi:hypothetical protein